jgi:acetyl esterase/lipase
LLHSHDEIERDISVFAASRTAAAEYPIVVSPDGKTLAATLDRHQRTPDRYHCRLLQAVGQEDHMNRRGIIDFAMPAVTANPVPLSGYMALNRPDAQLQISYGALPSQGIDVFLPAGTGPHPIAILIHGGCYRARPGLGREQLRHLGADLSTQGIAVWSIGYRRATEPGGGYPGTYQDVSEGIDRLRAEASHYNLDLSRNVIIGHSVGGHLALWAAARRSLQADGPLFKPDPFIPNAVIGLAGIGDMQSLANFCDPDIAERMSGATEGGATARYAEVSPAQMGPPSGSVLLISGVYDPVVPPFAALNYAHAMRTKRERPIELLELPQMGHFDFLVPGTPAWAEVRNRIELALGVDARAQSPKPEKLE